MSAAATAPDAPARRAGRVGHVEFLGLLVVMSLCMLHLLRNVSPVFPALYGVGASLLFAAGLRWQRVTAGQLAILACYAWIILVSLYFSQDHGSPVVGIVRMLYLAPLVLYLYGVRLDDRQAMFAWFLLGGFVALAAISIFFQIVFGAIPWFAEASERAGTTRFASLAGSLTAFGSIVGPACFLAWMSIRSRPAKYAFVVMLFVASLLSLQKAAILGALLGVLLGVASDRGRAGLLTLAKAGAGLAVLGLAFAFVVINWLPADLQDSLALFVRGALGEGGSGDVSIARSIEQRFVDMPLGSIEFFGPMVMLTGAGVFGASGALGYPHLPMMHNLPGEILIVGGLPVFLVFAATSIVAVARSLRWLASRDPGDRRARVAAGVFLLSFVVGLNTGSLHFHPVIGLFYWFSLRELLLIAPRRVRRGAS